MNKEQQATRDASITEILKKEGASDEEIKKAIELGWQKPDLGAKELLALTKDQPVDEAKKEADAKAGESTAASNQPS